LTIWADHAAPGQPPQKLTPALRAFWPNTATAAGLREMAAVIGVGKELIRQVWKEAELRPHRMERSLASDDPGVERKAAVIIGPCLNPPQHAAVFCVDESPGRAERHGFEYYRHGPLSLFAALNPQTGTVMGRTASRPTSIEFVRFLDGVVASCLPDHPVHIILDNLSVDKSESVREFLAQHRTSSFISLRRTLTG
jgi:hypothetical protein